MTTKQKFDDLATDYHASRPRYPAALLAQIVEHLPARSPLTVVDAGAGTGIALEGLIPLLGDAHRYLAVDVSAGMVDAGRAAFPTVDWAVGTAEPYLEGLDHRVELVIAAQAYQWMERERFVRASLDALTSDGVLAIVQNNRDHDGSEFLGAYEDLLETFSPGYSRAYRDFDVAAELAAQVEPRGGRVETSVVGWTRPMGVQEFVQMSSSSTQVQRAVAAEGPGFLDRVAELSAEHAQGGQLALLYRSELYLGLRAG